MALSVRGAGTRTRKAQPTLLGFAKVAKPSITVRNGKKYTPSGPVILSKLVNEEKPQPVSVNKRKWDDVSEAEESATEECTPIKKIKGSLPTPPSSDRSSRSPSPPPMPQGLKDLLELYKYFIKAFSLHRALNGRTAPAELNELMLSMTRLYKKMSIGKENIQRMLAIYEGDEKTEIPAKATLTCNESPFKLITSGVGSNRRNFVEYTADICPLKGYPPWKEKSLLDDYKLAIESAYLYGRRKPLSYMHSPLSDYPLLAFTVGAQTIRRQQKASELRKHVLGDGAKRGKSPELSNLSITDPYSPPQASQAIKARTLSLFERVKAKQAANAATATPTPEAILRHHAIGRTAEVVEILKMKQHQKVNFELGPSEYSAPETPMRRVSFTLTELVKVVKGSMTNAMSDEELKTCIDILAREVPGFWLKRLNIDGVLCIVMQGNGPVGNDIQKTLKAKASHELDAEICETE